MPGIKSKTQTERELLHRLAIACYRAPAGPLMNCADVADKVAKLEHHTMLGLYSADFDDRFCQRTGNLNQDFSMTVDCHGKVTVYRRSRWNPQPTQEQTPCLPTQIKLVTC